MSILVFDIAYLWDKLSIVFEIVLNFAGISPSVVLNVTKFIDFFIIHQFIRLKKLLEIDRALLVDFTRLCLILDLMINFYRQMHFGSTGVWLFWKISRTGTLNPVFRNLLYKFLLQFAFGCNCP